MGALGDDVDVLGMMELIEGMDGCELCNKRAYTE